MPKNKKNKSGVYIAILIIIFLILAGIIIYCMYWGKDAEEKEDEADESEEVAIEQEEEKYEELVDVIQQDKIETEVSEEDEDVAKETEGQSEDADDDSNVVKENIYVAVYGNTKKYSVEYPDNWRPHEVSNKNEVGFVPPGSSPSDEYIGDITISYKENPDKLSVDRFYDGLNDVNLFEDASGGYVEEKIGGHSVYIFSEVIGYVPSTVAVIVLDDAFVEIIDVQNKHQDNSVFKNFIETFKEEGETS